MEGKHEGKWMPITQERGYTGTPYFAKQGCPTRAGESKVEIGSVCTEVSGRGRITSHTRQSCRFWNSHKLVEWSLKTPSPKFLWQKWTLSSWEGGRGWATDQGSTYLSLCGTGAVRLSCSGDRKEASLGKIHPDSVLSSPAVTTMTVITAREFSAVWEGMETMEHPPRTLDEGSEQLHKLVSVDQPESSVLSSTRHLSEPRRGWDNELPVNKVKAFQKINWGKNI